MGRISCPFFSRCQSTQLAFYMMNFDDFYDFCNLSEFLETTANLAPGARTGEVGVAFADTVSTGSAGSAGSSESEFCVPGGPRCIVKHNTLANFPGE